MPAPSGYSQIQIVLHWIVAILIAMQLILHDGIEDAWHALRDGRTPEFDLTAQLHVYGGLLVLALALSRFAIRARRGAPPPPEQEHPLLKLAARLTHGALYLVMVLMPASGALAWYGEVAVAARVHSLIETVLYVFLALHIGGALYQRFVLKSDVLDRMLNPGS